MKMVAVTFCKKGHPLHCVELSSGDEAPLGAEVMSKEALIVLCEAKPEMPRPLKPHEQPLYKRFWKWIKNG